MHALATAVLFTPVLVQIRGKPLHRIVVATVRGEQQPLVVQVEGDGDVVLASLHAGVVDAHQAHRTHVLLGARPGHVVLDAPPQLLVAYAQHPGGLAHGQALAQRQRERLEQQRKATALARPRHAHLAGLAAGRALHAWHPRVQPRLELEEVQMPPGAAVAVVNELIRRPAARAGKPLCRASDLEVDAMLRSVELDTLDPPRRLKAKGRCKQRFDLHTHDQRSR
jgi:hypothetical protein